MKKVRPVAVPCRACAPTDRCPAGAALPLDERVHLALQRGREEGQVEGEPHLEHRREEDAGGRVGVPPVPPPHRGRVPGRRVRGAQVAVPPARVGPAGRAEQPPRALREPGPARVAQLDGGRPRGDAGRGHAEHGARRRGAGESRARARLSGRAGADAVAPQFTLEGKEVLLSQKYFLSVAPLSRDEPGAYAGARRASLPTSSNSVVPRSAPRRRRRTC